MCSDIRFNFHSLIDCKPALVVTTYCHLVVCQLLDNEKNLSGGIFEHLKIMLQQVSQCKIQFQSRATNGIAHRLTKIGHSFHSGVV